MRSKVLGEAKSPCMEECQGYKGVVAGSRRTHRHASARIPLPEKKRISVVFPSDWQAGPHLP